MPTGSVRSAIILKADRLYADALRSFVLRHSPDALCRDITRLALAAPILAEAGCDLLVTGLAFPDGDALDLLAGLSQRPHRPRRILVVTTRREPWLLAALRQLPVNGVYDADAEPPEALGVAFESALSGRGYWSRSLSEPRTVSIAAQALRILTPTERLVLSVIGDGCDDRVAAGCLGFTPSSIQSIRRSLHLKLGAQHKGDLVRIAAECGFVRFTPGGVVRPGFGLLIAAYSARRRAAPGVSVDSLPPFAVPRLGVTGIRTTDTLDLG